MIDIKSNVLVDYQLIIRLGNSKHIMAEINRILMDLKQHIDICVFEKGHDTKTVSALVSLKTKASHRYLSLSTELISLLKEEKKHQEK